MTAQSPITNPRWQDFRTTVLPLFPRATDEEIEVRSRLLLIRDMAFRAMSYSTEEAYYLLHAIYGMASRYALLAVTLDQLKELRRILIIATANASAMQVLMNEIHYPGGTDARG